MLLLSLSGCLPLFNEIIWNLIWVKSWAKYAHFLCNCLLVCELFFLLSVCRSIGLSVLLCVHCARFFCFGRKKNENKMLRASNELDKHKSWKHWSRLNNTSIDGWHSHKMTRQIISKWYFSWVALFRRCSLFFLTFID